MTDQTQTGHQEFRNFPSLRIGISRCLLGEEVRFDGRHKKDLFLTQTLSRFVEWVPVCPEVEAGLGLPREAMRLVGSETDPKLITIKSARDHTAALLNYSKQRIRELRAEMLDGFVFKRDSPSCGLERVRVYNEHGMPFRKGVGLFARTFTDRFPLIPVEEEGRLNDPRLRENFIVRVFCYHRWRLLSEGRMSRGTLVKFHTQHKMLLLAHSRPHYLTLGQLVAKSKDYTTSQLAHEYGAVFMEALKVKSTTRKHMNVLQHLTGYFKTHLTLSERKELQEILVDYHQGLTPLIVPITLIRHYVRLHRITYLQDQIYLNPHPKELMLRNHV